MRCAGQILPNSPGSTARFREYFARKRKYRFPRNLAAKISLKMPTKPLESFRQKRSSIIARVCPEFYLPLTPFTFTQSPTLPGERRLQDRFGLRACCFFSWRPPSP